MSEKFTVRKANENDIPLIQNMIKDLAAYEKRPQDMTGSQKNLHYWLFERKIADVLIAEYNSEAIGYAVYYPVFGSFAAAGGVRHCGLGRKFFSEIEEYVKQEGYTKMEWNCLDWNI